MHTLKFLSVAASFLYFAIAQGVVIDAEPVPLYGQCECRYAIYFRPLLICYAGGTKIGTVCTIFDSSSRLAHLALFSACSANRNLASAIFFTSDSLLI
jgi:hypothetical protein